MNQILDMGTANTNQRLGDVNWPFWVVLTFLIGLLFFSYPPLRIVSDGTRLLRPDWILALPLFGYFIVAKQNVRLTRPVLFTFLFVFVAGVSFFLSPMRSPFKFMTVFLQLVLAVGLFVVLANMQLDRETFILLLRVWVAILVVFSAYTMYEFIAINLGLPLSKLYNRGLPPSPLLANRYYRPVAIFIEPGYLSSFLATGIAVLLPPVAMRRDLLFSKQIQRAFLILIAAGVLASVAFSGYVTVGLSLIILALLPPLRDEIVRFWVLAIILTAVGFVSLLSIAPGAADSVLKRVNTAGRIFDSLAENRIATPRGSIGARWVRFLSGIEATTANPLLGVGPGQFSDWIKSATITPLPSDDRYGSLHGGYIQVLSQTGIIGITIFIGVWIFVIRRLLQGITTSEGDDYVLALICTCMVTFMLVGWLHSFGMIHTVRWGMLGLFYGYVTTK